MIAAIYARKSTERNGMAAEARSVTRQIEHAKAYAERKGWTVADEHIYMDDGISGENLPTIQNVMNPRSLTPTAIYARLNTQAVDRALQAQADRLCRLTERAPTALITT